MLGRPSEIFRNRQLPATAARLRNGGSHQGQNLMKPNLRPRTAVVSYSKNVVDTAAAAGNFSTFGKALGHCGLDETLRGPGPFTIFAPTDEAFARLGHDKLEALFMPKNRQKLRALLDYHVLTGQKSIAELGRWDAARTMHGQMTAISLVDQEVHIDGALVTTADIGSSNGVIHAIDKVNMPATA
jgi:uncharacterized surface protein with fasciclin (FAS1) repeats